MPGKIKYMCFNKKLQNQAKILHTIGLVLSIDSSSCVSLLYYKSEKRNPALLWGIKMSVEFLFLFLKKNLQKWFV